MTLFEWDPVKAQSNRRKHGVLFEAAMRVFDDPYAIYELDRAVEGESRWQIVGLFEGVVLLMVAYAVWDEGPRESIRIISARKATRKERLAYEQNRQEVDG
jgi:uncharacterized DUF497 family protein